MAFPDGWTRKCKITIPDAQISGSNTDFPIVLTASNFPTEMLDGGANSALNGGGDVRFSGDSAGTIRLACEIVTCVTGGSPAAEIWVKLSSLNTGADHEFYVWYNKSGEIQPAVMDVYGRNAVWSDYQRVFHMNSGVDSSGNGDFTLIGSPTTITGVMGGGMRFNGVDQRGDLGWNGVIQDYTLTAVMRSPNAPFSPGSGPINGNGLLINWNINSGSDSKTWLNTAGSGWQSLNFGASSPDTNYWLTATYDGAEFKIYTNGVSVSSTSASGAVGARHNFVIASHSAATYRFLEADIFFVAITLLPRSADWLSTEYNNQSAPIAFASAGTPETVGGAAVLGSQDATNSLISNIVTFAQGHSVNPIGGNHNFVSDHVVIGLGQSVAIEEGRHSLVSDGPILVQIQELVLSSTVHNLVNDSVVLSQGYGLFMNDIRQGLISDDVTFSQLQALLVQNATHGLGSDQVAVIDPTAFTPSPGRTLKATGKSRILTPNAGDRTTQPINI